MRESKETTQKHDRVLEIYSRLLSGDIVRKQEMADEYGVTPRSIQRDIDTIRNFYANHMARHGEMTEIQYDRAEKGFRIRSTTIALTNQELFAIAKILLESRSLCRREMGTMIKHLVNVCLPEAERKIIRELLQNELFHYVEPRHGKALVQTVWELGMAVYQHRILHLDYEKATGEVSSADIKPVGIMESEYYFYLIAYIGDKDKEYPGFPTVYRVDRIKSFHATGERFQVPYKDRFEEGEFRKRIPFMYSGKLHKVSFVYTGTDINAVLDRLPTAAAVRRDDGSYQVTAEVFGKTGVDMWLRSQGDRVRWEV